MEPTGRFSEPTTPFGHWAALSSSFERSSRAAAAAGPAVIPVGREAAVLDGGVLRYLRLVASLPAHAEGAMGASGTLAVAQLTRHAHAVVLFPSTRGEKVQEVQAILDSISTTIAVRNVPFKVRSCRGQRRRSSTLK